MRRRRSPRPASGKEGQRATLVSPPDGPGDAPIGVDVLDPLTKCGAFCTLA